MTKYRIAAYMHGGLLRYKVQRRVWWGWKTVANQIVMHDYACGLARNLIKSDKEFGDREGREHS